MENLPQKTTIHRIKMSVCMSVLLIGFCSNYVLAFDDKYYSPDMKNSDPELVKDIFKTWELLGQSHQDIQVLDEALDLLKPYLETHSNDPILLWKWSEFIFYKAESLKNEEQRLSYYWEALDFARRSLEISPSLEAHFWAGCNAARLAEMEKGFTAMKLVNEALERLKQVSEIDPKHYLSAPTDTILAAIYMEAPWPIKDLENAEKYLLAAKEKDPNLTMTCEKLAAFHLMNKDYKKAETEAKNCLAVKHPTFIWDSVLYNWPNVKKTLARAQASTK